MGRTDRIRRQNTDATRARRKPTRLSSRRLFFCESCKVVQLLDWRSGRRIQIQRSLGAAIESPPTMSAMLDCTERCYARDSAAPRFRNGAARPPRRGAIGRGGLMYAMLIVKEQRVGRERGDGGRETGDRSQKSGDGRRGRFFIGSIENATGEREGEERRRSRLRVGLGPSRQRRRGSR